MQGSSFCRRPRSSDGWCDLGIGPEPRVVLVVDNLLHTLVEKSGELFFGVCALHRNDGRLVQMPDEDVRAPFPCIGIGDSLYLRCMEDGCQKAVAEGLTEHVQADTGRQTVGKKPCKVFRIRLPESLIELSALGASKAMGKPFLQVFTKDFLNFPVGNGQNLPA